VAKPAPDGWGWPREAAHGAQADRQEQAREAEQQIERPGEDGLAGAGLAGDDVEAGGQLEAGVLDQEEVLHGQLEEHRRRRAATRTCQQASPCPLIEPGNI